MSSYVCRSRRQPTTRQRVRRIRKSDLGGAPPTGVGSRTLQIGSHHPFALPELPIRIRKSNPENQKSDVYTPSPSAPCQGSLSGVGSRIWAPPHAGVESRKTEVLSLHPPARAPHLEAEVGSGNLPPRMSEIESRNTTAPSLPSELRIRSRKSDPGASRTEIGRQKQESEV